MPKWKLKLDSIISRQDFATLISARLEELKRRVWQPARIAGKRIRERILPAGWAGNFFIFAAAATLVLLLFATVSAVGSGVRFSKQILGAATAGFSDLQSGKLQSALGNFQQAAQELQTSNDALINLLGNIPGGLDTKRLEAGSGNVQSALQYAGLGLSALQKTRLTWDSATNSSSQDFYLALRESRGYLFQSATDLSSAEGILSGINTVLWPADFQQKFVQANQRLIQAHDVVQEVVAAQDFLLSILGGEKKDYLLIFQNNNEARATGGFIGTYGLLTFENGQMRLDKIESIYNLDGQLKEAIAAPGPLQRLETPYWGIRDSNWFADFPTSSEKILSFLQKENGVAADGIISFTPDVFEKLLAITGPIPMPEYGVILTAENFRETAQYKTSVDYNKQLNEPKKFLADFAPKFLSKLQGLDANQSLEVFTILSQMVAEKQILLYSRNSALEKTIGDFGIDGAIKSTPGDYLAIIHSNVGGGKTDLHILQNVEEKVSVLSGGDAIVDLKITRTHQGFGEKFFPENLDYMRIFVPAGAKLLSAAGFDDAALLPSALPDATVDPDLASWDRAITRDDKTGMYVGSESGYTVFSNWLELLPGQIKTVELTYEITLPNDKSYTLLLQKQAGSIPFDFSLTVDYLGGGVAYFYPDDFRVSGSQLELQEQVDTDRFYGIVRK